MPKHGRTMAGGSRGGRVWPFAPVALALASVLDPLSRNLHLAAWEDAGPAFAAGVAAALAIWLIVVRLRGRADAGAALIASVWTAGSLHYLEIFRRLNDAIGGDYSQLRALPFALAIMVGLTLALRGTRGWHGFAHVVVACVAAAVVIGPTWRAAAFEWRHMGSRSVWDGARAFSEEPGLAAAAAPAGELPDIYDFVFDRYGSEETLAGAFGVDDAAGAYLEGQGFYVARDSFANYVSTGLSLASTFNMRHLDAVAADPRASGGDWRPLFAMIDDSVVGRYLRGLGYDQRQYGSWWVGTHHNPNAAVNRPMGLSEFGMAWLRRSIALPLTHLFPGSRAAMLLSWDNGQCQRVARQVEEIKGLRRDGRPLYVFAHFLLPHGPFPFTADGECLGWREAAARGDQRGYAEQAEYAAAVIRELTGALLAPGRPPAVILIHADEGPIPEREKGVPWQDASPEELRVKFGILQAARFPGGDYRRMRQDLSPVNLYRAMLATEFGLDLPDLPDGIYVFPDSFSIYDLRDVTSRVRCGAPEGGGDPGC
ncbi:hypothetical protein [Amaricoccus sp.]|uniref:hypothetical protein n=1 Tax=Amaricoccus sp. TaxID=1872485 RepID=UPI001B599785|nr:hypothetical protein [Amaricoccus sp.]MBP7003658.1 hypothetical protein [Amaricoccus sp.]